MRQPDPRRDDAAVAEPTIADIHRTHESTGTLAVEPTDQRPLRGRKRHEITVITPAFE